MTTVVNPSAAQESHVSVIPLYRLQEPHPQARQCAACGVRALALFGVLDEAGLDRIHAHIATVELAPGETLFEAGVRGLSVFTVRSGVLRMERVTERGDRRIVRLAGRGTLVGQEALLRRPNADEAVACTPVQLCRIPVTLIEELSASHPQIVRELMSRWQLALEEAEAWFAELATGPARRRMLRLIDRLAGLTDGESLWLPRRDEMGAMLGMTVETASRAISSLKRDGVLHDVTLGAARLDAAALAQALRKADAD